jgi:hypothetical protein
LCLSVVYLLFACCFLVNCLFVVCLFVCSLFVACCFLFVRALREVSPEIYNSYSLIGV